MFEKYKEVVDNGESWSVLWIVISAKSRDFIMNGPDISWKVELSLRTVQIYYEKSRFYYERSRYIMIGWHFIMSGRDFHDDRQDFIDDRYSFSYERWRFYYEQLWFS